MSLDEEVNRLDDRGYILEIQLKHPISERDGRWMGVAVGQDLEDLLAVRLPGCEVRVYDLTTGEVHRPAAR